MRRASPLPAILLALAVSPALVTAQAKTWAVVVGINDYIHLDGVDGGDLLGAENDADAFVEYLTTGLGVPTEQILLLKGREATSRQVRNGLKNWLAERARPGDRVYFFYSGHGSQVLDLSGDEEDGLDETLSPADALPLSPENDIVDDEIDSMLSSLQADEIVVILDSCSSGTGTKVAGGIEGRPRRLQRPFARPKAGGTDSRGSGFVEGDPGRIIELAASGPDQTALDAEFPGEDGNTTYAGAFTTYLLEALWAAPDSKTLSEVLAEVTAAMTDGRFEQRPRFSGSGSAPVRVPPAGTVPPA